MKIGRNIYGAVFSVWILALMLFLYFFNYNQLYGHFQKMKWDNFVNNENFRAYLAQYGSVQESLSRENTSLSKENASLRQGFTQTRELMKKVEEENAQLKEKIRLLGQISDVERSIAELKDQTALMAQEKRGIPSAPGSVGDAEQFTTIAQARAAMAQHRSQIRSAKKRIRALMRRQKEDQAVIRRELDQMMTLLGNNGYLVREGNVMPVDSPAPNNALTVEVQFVE